MTHRHVWPGHLPWGTFGILGLYWEGPYGTHGKAAALTGSLRGPRDRIDCRSDDKKDVGVNLEINKWYALYMYVCMYVCVCMCRCVCMYVCMSVCVCMYVFNKICLTLSINAHYMELTSNK